MDKIGRYEFQAEPFQTDMDGLLPLSVVSNQMLSCADYHSRERGFGMPTLNAGNATWVVSRFVIELAKRPLSYEYYTIETYIESIFKLFTSRCFRLISREGETMGYARSVWAMLDTNTRRPLNLTTLYGEELSEYVCTDLLCPIEKPTHLVGIDSSVCTAPQIIRPAYSDIDINGHFNSIRYMSHILDSLPIERISTIRRIEMSYIAEAYAADTLELLSHHEEDTVSFEFRKAPDNNPVCRSKIIF